ncbi:hypothetical protein C5167_015923 [Papaver somniferum]|nr:hypothetical protein C5167_015923 [Papaver somniferum]
MYDQDGVEKTVEYRRFKHFGWRFCLKSPHISKHTIPSAKLPRGIITASMMKIYINIPTSAAELPKSTYSKSIKAVEKQGMSMARQRILGST